MFVLFWGFYWALFFTVIVVFMVICGNFSVGLQVLIVKLEVSWF